ncbi:hypothetical protein INN71_15030 [Nocardioides sp. ChNu-153]|uniref:hypothetical protein n=1 Tax=Nocardioides sp. ChNu-153 TaxID=2779364 RepID=UPI002655A417|nr:hypothetical protein [Nocardioides sp. ChNu-153]MDN7122702.1 hypothetical protein [Nocardioides sp. ChNu-153]
MTPDPSDQVTLAHSGLGNAADLPIPLEAVVIGSVVALAASFLVLAVAWRKPRYDGPGPGTTRMRPWAPGAVRRIGAVVDHPVVRVLARLLGAAFFAYMMFALVVGPDYATNPGLGMFYVLLWVGIVPASLFLGRFYRAVSPVRTINAGLSRLAGTDPEHGLRELPSWVGYWPAAIGLYAFVWLELVSTNGVETSAVRLWLAAYFALMLVGGAVFGNVFYERCDPFEAYSTLVAHVSVWGRDADGTLVARSPLANLATLRPAAGLVALVAVLFGSTAYDSFRESLPFVRFVNTSTLDSDLILNVALIGVIAIVGVLLTLASAAVPAREGIPRRALPSLMAHSIAPIIVGYVGAHYLTYLLEFGQQVVIYMSDPLAQGSNWLGTANLQPSYFLSDNIGLLAFVQVSGVVVGHVVAAVAAHDRSLSVLPRQHQLVGQLPMLGVMIAFTGGGLYLLFAS